MYQVPAKIYHCQIARSISIIEVHKFYRFGNVIEAFGKIVRWWLR